MQAESAGRRQALHAMLDASLQPDSSEEIRIPVLQFVGNQVAAMVQSSTQESEEQAAQLQRLMHTSMTMVKVTSVATCLGLHLVRPMPSVA